MVFVIVHELQGAFRIGGAVCAGRMRIRTGSGLALDGGERDAVLRALASVAGVHGAAAGRRTGSVLLYYEDASSRLAALRLLASASPARAEGRTEAQAPAAGAPSSPAAAALLSLARYVLLKPFMPRWLAFAAALRHAWPFFAKSFRDLAGGRGWSGVIDACALALCLFRGAYGAARTLGILFGMAGQLESWTRQSPFEPAGRGLPGAAGFVWVAGPGGRQVRKPLASLAEGDVVTVRTGGAIPADGIVVDGEGEIDSSAFLGVPAGVHIVPGGKVCAGCTVADGTLCVKVTALGGETELGRIARRVKAPAGGSLGGRFRRLAAPFILGLSGAAWLFTGSAASALTVLAVNLACVRRLAGPVAELAALREAALSGVAARSGGCLEKLCDIDTVVFDKTGTLTASAPRLAEVVAAPGFDRTELLRGMACLEEHFPHPVARAVVKAAADLGLDHPEEHGEVQYIVAHGVLSLVHGQEVVVGSRHFVEADEGIDLSPLAADIARQTALGRQLVFIGIGGRLAGMLSMEDPPRREARSVIQALRRLGVSRILMITGDDERAARHMAGRLGIAEYRAGVLPAGKSAIVEELARQGRRVLMVGDGINDAPALSASYVGVAMRDGADLARGAAGVVLANESLKGLIVAKLLGGRIVERVRNSVLALMIVNSAIVAGGAGGILSPARTAFLQSLGAIMLSLRSLGRNVTDRDVMDAMDSWRFQA